MKLSINLLCFDVVVVVISYVFFFQFKISEVDLKINIRPQPIEMGSSECVRHNRRQENMKILVVLA